MDQIQKYKILKAFDLEYHPHFMHSGMYIPKLSEFMPPDQIEPMLIVLVAEDLLEKKSERISITKKGEEIIDTEFWKEQAYDIVDAALKTIQHHNSGINTDHRINRIQNFAKKILRDNYLVNYLSYPEELSVVELREEGHQVIEEGGIRNYLQKKNPGEFETLKPTSMIFDKGEVFSAFVELSNIIKEAKRDVILVDSYVSYETLVFFQEKQNNVQVKIITTQNCITETFKRAVDLYNLQHGNLIIATDQDYHDRFLIIDDREFYHIGASIKDAGKKTFMFTRFEGQDLIAFIRSKIQMTANNVYPV